MAAVLAFPHDRQHIRVLCQVVVLLTDVESRGESLPSSIKALQSVEVRMDIFEAIRNGDAAAATRLLDADPSLTGARQNNISPLLFALYFGRADILRLLLDRGAAVSFAEACAIGDADLAQRLLDADPSLLDRRSEDGF